MNNCNGLLALWLYLKAGAHCIHPCVLLLTAPLQSLADTVTVVTSDGQASRDKMMYKPHKSLLGTAYL